MKDDLLIFLLLLYIVLWFHLQVSIYSLGINEEGSRKSLCPSQDFEKKTFTRVSIEKAFFCSLIEIIRKTNM